MGDINWAKAGVAFGTGTLSGYSEFRKEQAAFESEQQTKEIDQMRKLRFETLSKENAAAYNQTPGAQADASLQAQQAQERSAGVAEGTVEGTNKGRLGEDYQQVQKNKSQLDIETDKTKMQNRAEIQLATDSQGRVNAANQGVAIRASAAEKMGLDPESPEGKSYISGVPLTAQQEYYSKVDITAIALMDNSDLNEAEAYRQAIQKTTGIVIQDGTVTQPEAAKLLNNEMEAARESYPKEEWLGVFGKNYSNEDAKDKGYNDYLKTIAADRVDRYNLTIRDTTKSQGTAKEQKVEAAKTFEDNAAKAAEATVVYTNEYINGENQVVLDLEATNEKIARMEKELGDSKPKEVARTKELIQGIVDREMSGGAL